MSRISKPLSGRPLFATAADRQLYVSRPQVEERVRRAVERELNALVVADRGAGKTTLLQHVLFDARHRPGARRTVYLDGSIVRSAMDVIDLLRDALDVPPHLGENVAAGFRSLTKPGAVGAREATLLLDRLRPLREVDPAVVLVDGLNDADIAHALFGRLRDELWALPLTWVVSTDPDQLRKFLTPPADAFFESIIELSPFDAHEQTELLKRRLPDEWTRVQALVGKDRGNPRQLLNATRQAVVEGHPIEDVLQAAAMRQNRAEQVGRAASMVYRELEALDRPVAASDEELLQRLDISRERAGQLLNQLEQADLLESFHGTPEGGRPRKMYRLRDILSAGDREPPDER